MISFVQAAKILMSCIPSLLNEERDSFPIENAREWGGSRDYEVLHELKHWPGNSEGSGKGTLFASQKQQL